MALNLIGEITSDELAHLLAIPTNQSIKRELGEPFVHEVVALYDQFATAWSNGAPPARTFDAYEPGSEEKVGFLDTGSIATQSWYICSHGDTGAVYLDRPDSTPSRSSSARERSRSVGHYASFILRYLLPRRGYEVISGQTFVCPGGIGMISMSNIEVTGIRLSTSMRSMLMSLDRDGKHTNVMSLFKRGVTTGVLGNQIMYRSAGRTDRMNYLTARENGNISYLPTKAEVPDNPWARAGRQDMRPGRFIRAFFSPEDLVRAGVTDKHIEAFATAFAADSAPPEGIEIISGAEIRQAYHERNYSQRENTGEMGSSCMRYGSCQTYFDIYIENPNQIMMCVVKDADKKYVARTILWTDENGERWYDRIYGTHVLQRQISSWLEDQDIRSLRNASSRVVVRPEKPFHTHYPYMDTMLYIHSDGHMSTRYHDYIDYETLTSTSGGPSISTRICSVCGEMRFRGGLENGVCQNCLNTRRNALIANLRKPGHRIRSIAAVDMSWMGGQRDLRSDYTNTMIGGASVVKLFDIYWRYRPAENIYARLTKRDVMKLMAKDRANERAKEKMLKTCVTDRTVIMQALADAVFPGSFDITTHLREGVHWGWVNAAADTIYLRESTDAEWRIVAQVRSQPAIPWGYGLTFVRTEKLVNGSWEPARRRNPKALERVA